MQRCNFFECQCRSDIRCARYCAGGDGAARHPYHSAKQIQSQRDCVCQPRVARNELPWVAADSDPNPNGVASRFQGLATTPLGLFGLAAMSQGSSFLATLGFRPESLWDSVLEFPKRIEAGV